MRAESGLAIKYRYRRLGFLYHGILSVSTMRVRTGSTLVSLWRVMSLDMATEGRCASEEPVAPGRGLGAELEADDGSR